MSSFVEYNSVRLDLVNIPLIERVNETDESGTDALWTRWTFQIQAVVNNEVLTSADFAGKSSVDIDILLRERLGVHRKKLKYAVRSGINGPVEQVMLESPRPGVDYDAKNGPIVTGLNITRAIGGATFLVDLGITTWVADSRSSKALVSNRYSMSHDISEDMYLSIRVVGTAIIRRDQKDVLNPDRLRKELLLPVPPGFRRTNLQVQGDSTGQSVTYSYDDIQRAHYLYPYDSKATRIEGYHTIGLGSDKNIYTEAITAVDRYYERLASKKWAGQNDPSGSAPTPGNSGSTSAVTGAAKNIKNIIPKFP
jgi:hypothetical protein